MDNIKSHAYEQMNIATEQYEKKTQGNGITEETVAGVALENEDVFTIDSPEERLNIDEAKEIYDVNIEMIKTALQSYIADLETAKRVLDDVGKSEISYEIERIRRRIQSTIEELEDNAG